MATTSDVATTADVPPVASPPHAVVIRDALANVRRAHEDARTCLDLRAVIVVTRTPTR
jgi:hypothetical protein